jgi:hypothetical protein
VGKNIEQAARLQYTALVQTYVDANAVCQMKGLCLNENLVGLGCSPDSVVTIADPFTGEKKTLLLEIKCVYSRKDIGLRAERKKEKIVKQKNGEKIVVEKVLPFYAKPLDPPQQWAGMDLFHLDLSHNQARQYNDQIQLSLNILCLDEAHLFMWTTQNWGLCHITRDRNWDFACMGVLTHFANNYLLPEALRKGVFYPFAWDNHKMTPAIARNSSCFYCDPEADAEVGVTDDFKDLFKF